MERLTKVRILPEISLDFVLKFFERPWSLRQFGNQEVIIRPSTSPAPILPG